MAKLALNKSNWLVTTNQNAYNPQVMIHIYVCLGLQLTIIFIPFYLEYFVNSLPNHKILDWSKVEALADDKINVTEQLKFILGRVGNIVGKGERLVSSI